MNKILAKTRLSAEVYRMDIEAPLIARSRKAGQFVILQVSDTFGERVPLTIADADAQTGRVTIIFQAVGATTRRLAEMNVGDELPVFLGPLGRPTEVRKYGTVVCVGGGIGVAPMHPIAQAMKAAGNRVIVIMGARTKELLILEEAMRRVADELIITTDDGSAGRKDLVTIPLKEVCEREKVDCAVVIGPPIMMKFCALTTKPFGIHTMASLNAIMIDGTGMCGGCRVSVGGKTRFVCVDGPEFDAHQVDFDNLMQRLKAFKPQERDHLCNLERMARGAEAQQ
ncbi:MAG: sulfide/dihydroorotate dehydrogenase-like FAD/NAD-binding protein [Kiritimatiellia bacterium]|nr:sulfide/dihydroorotate dehydrogenase-like FAD/NAD-binding protein [Kiritimatiellia bacterium]